MKSSGATYDYLASFDRLDRILAAADADYIEQNTLPSRESLTFTNGYYVNCSAIFVDIRGSSKLPEKYRRPALARLYRAYISEVVAVMDGHSLCREVNIVGDGVWGVFNSPYKNDIDRVFECAYTIASLIKTLNYKIKKLGYEELRVGIGVDYGRALVIKAGYAGSGINEVVYMGEVVNQAAKLCAHGLENPWSDKQIMVSSLFRQNVSDENQALLQFNYNRGCYHGNVIRSDMDAWYNENCM